VNLRFGYLDVRISLPMPFFDGSKAPG